MKLMRMVPINHAPMTGVVLSVVCWLAFYAVYADFAEPGLDLLQASGLQATAAGAFLVGLYAFGLLLLLAFGLAAIAVLIKLGVKHYSHDNGYEG